MPRISVIVPVYNVEPYLNRCVDSILMQSFADFELILVDDGSPDNCPAICDEYAQKDDRVHVVHQENGGLSAARNAGIDWAFANSDSEWITFVDSDDWIHVDYLMSLINAAIAGMVSISVSHVEFTEAWTLTDVRSESEVEISSPELFWLKNPRIRNSSCGRLFRRELFHETRFPLAKLYEDAFTTYKLFFFVDKIAVVKGNLYYYYQRNESIMHMEWSNKKLDAYEALNQQIDYFHSNGYLDAYLCTLENYCWKLKDDIDLLKADKRKECKCLVKMLKQQIRNNDKITFVSGKYFGIYEAAYPIRMKLYWLWKVIVSKLRGETKK